MKFFLLKVVVVVVTVFLSIGFGYDWLFRGNERPEIKLATIPDDSLKNKEVHNFIEQDLSSFPEIARETNYHKLVNYLDSSDAVYEPHVGIGGTYTFENVCYERFENITPPQELLYLTFHKNPIIRAYAYKALCAKDSERAVYARRRLKNDTGTFKYMSGCIGMTENLEEFVKYYEIK